MKLTNVNGIDLPIAVWAIQEGYKSGADVAPQGELISVTTLMKPTRQLILQRKVDMTAESVDVSDMLASRMGHTLHDGLERAWTEGNWQQSMRRLGFTQDIIDRIKINPDPSTVVESDIPIYLEQRGFLEFEGIILTGQLDFSIGGAYRDFKTSSTFSYTSENKSEDYILQGSMYRLIMPNLIQKAKMRIEFIFTDWLRYRAKSDPKYPQAKAAHKEFDLLSIEDTKKWVSNKIAEIKANVGKSQGDMIRCTDKQLWKSEDSYKYYANTETAARGGRCSKRFDSEADAIVHMNTKGKGIIITDPGEVKACTYCSAFTICEQRMEYFDNDGRNIQKDTESPVV